MSGTVPGTRYKINEARFWFINDLIRFARA